MGGCNYILCSYKCLGTSLPGPSHHMVVAIVVPLGSIFYEPLTRQLALKETLLCVSLLHTCCERYGKGETVCVSEATR